MTESPCYSGAWHLFNYYGADITSIAVDNHGLQTDNLPEYETQLCYVTPAHQYPMGSVLSLERRQSLLTWAQRVGAYIIEDDYDAVFTYGDNPLPALKAMDYHNRVIYMGTFSKTLGPGARLGYLICPDELLPAVQNMKALNNNGSQWLLQQFLAELMQNQVFIRISASWPAAMRRASLCYAMACPLCFPKGKSLAQRQVCTFRYALPDIPNSSSGCNKVVCWLGSVSTLCRI